MVYDDNISFQYHFITCYVTIYGYYINYLKYTNNIPAKLFHYLLFYIKPYMINIIISGLTDHPWVSCIVGARWSSDRAFDCRSKGFWLVRILRWPNANFSGQTKWISTQPRCELIPWEGGVCARLICMLAACKTGIEIVSLGRLKR